MNHIKTKTSLAMLAFAAGLFTFTPETASAALPKIKTKARLALTVELQATADAPEGVAGSAIISVKQKNARQDARLRLDLDGVPAGTYSLDGSNAAGESLHLALIQIAEAKGKGNGGDQIKLVVPDEVDARSLISLTVSDSTSTVLLSGDTTTSTRLLRYFANVRVTAPVPAEEEVVTSDTEGVETTESSEVPESTESAEEAETLDPVADTDPVEETEDEVPMTESVRVHGHALIHSTITNDDVKKSKFLFVGHGAPVSATLTINVNGVAVGTVDSTAEGKVKFTTLPEEISLPAIRIISITDALGEAVMQAQF